MLCLSRKVGERILIGENISIVVTKQSGGNIGLGIEAPPSVKILRGELANAPSSRQLNHGSGAKDRNQGATPGAPLNNQPPRAA
jgi:carbon storage regulator CsrA